MKNILRDEILKLKDKKHVDQNILAKHLEFLKKEKFLTRPENPYHHFGIFFLPIHVSSKSIFLVNHIKAGGWIPPGGHLEERETPLETAIRECQEELSYKPKREEIELFDLSITPIRNKRSAPCRTHFDIWYLIYTRKQDFIFDKREFHGVSWFNVDEALSVMKHQVQKGIIEKVKKKLNL